ncbi:hypothetical protein [Streptomyces sp. NPDC048527]|uniref:hypothetical protein n=1 Tax=Streptomyces sp. NPDC048527 TaxID=3365568 RepID=UPI0037215C61
MSTQTTTDQMIRLAQEAASYTEEALLLRLVDYADDLYLAARREMVRQLCGASGQDDSAETPGVDRCLELLVDAVMDATPVAMAYRSVLSVIWQQISA